MQRVQQAALKTIETAARFVAVPIDVQTPNYIPNPAPVGTQATTTPSAGVTGTQAAGTASNGALPITTTGNGINYSPIACIGGHCIETALITSPGGDT